MLLIVIAAMQAGYQNRMRLLCSCQLSSFACMISKEQSRIKTWDISIYHYIIIRVHSGFLLVENCGLLEDRRTLTPFQRQANYSNFRIIDCQWRALFCIDYDHLKWSAKVFSSYYKAYFGKNFHISNI